MHVYRPVPAGPRRRRRARPVRGVIGALIAGLVVVIAAAPRPAAAESAEPGLFNTREVRSTDLRRFKKWNEMLARYAAEAAQAAKCDAAAGVACAYAEWNAFLDGIRQADRWHQLDAVNRYVNAREYVPDETNWGVKDHWATPGEFFARSGDCEDFAIVKYLSLKRLGWTDQELRIVAVEDRRLGIGHAIVVASVGGQTYALDNQLASVLETEKLAHYSPVYSINLTYWWLHRAS